MLAYVHTTKTIQEGSQTTSLEPYEHLLIDIGLYPAAISEGFKRIENVEEIIIAALGEGQIVMNIDRMRMEPGEIGDLLRGYAGCANVFIVSGMEGRVL